MLTFAATASAINLVDFIKPVLMLVVLGIYLRVLGQIFEKDLRYFNLKAGLWNSIFVATACIAIVVVLVIPIFWAGLPAMMPLLMLLAMSFLTYP